MMLYRTCRRCATLWNSDSKAREIRCPVCFTRGTLRTLTYGSSLQLTLERRADGLHLGCKAIGERRSQNATPLERSAAKETIDTWVNAWLEHFDRELALQEQSALNETAEDANTSAS